MHSTLGEEAHPQLWSTVLGFYVDCDGIGSEQINQDRWIDRQIDKQIKKNKQTNKQIDRSIERQLDRSIDRSMFDRQIDTPVHIFKHIISYYQAQNFQIPGQLLFELCKHYLKNTQLHNTVQTYLALANLATIIRGVNAGPYLH